MLRGYIETLLELPWDKASTDSTDLKRAEAILDEDHYGMEKVKERVLEFLAVRILTKRAGARSSVWWGRPERERPPSPGPSPGR